MAIEGTESNSSQTGTGGTSARRLLLDMDEVRRALGPDIAFDSAASDEPLPGAGSVMRAAAVDSAYRRFAGRSRRDSVDSPFAVSAMALVFDAPTTAEHTFAEVARAAHLRTEVDGSRVAVETVTTPAGLVSYWGFVHRDSAMVILTLDTVDSQRLSIGDLRSLVSEAARRLERASEP